MGTWQLPSFTMVYADTGEKVESFGAHPRGFLGYAPDGRMYAIIVHEQRKRPEEIPSDAEPIELFAGMGAYPGTYTIEGNSTVDVSWIEGWTGTTQVRKFRVDGNSLHIESPPAKDPLDGRISTASLVWLKIE